MYFWSIKRAQDSLKNCTHSSREILPYVLAYVLLMSVTTELLPRLSNSPDNIWSIAIALTSILMSGLGAFYVFLKNGGSQGENFLERYLVIGWVVSVQWIVVLFSLGISSAIIVFALEIPVSDSDTPLMFVFSVLANIFFYYYVGAKVGDISKSSSSVEQR